MFDSSKNVPAKLRNDPLVVRFQKTIQECSISIVKQTGSYKNGTLLRLAADVYGKQPFVYAFGDDIVIGENATAGLISIYEPTGLPVLGTQEIEANNGRSPEDSVVV